MLTILTHPLKPAGYDSGRHKAYLEKLDYIEDKVMPQFIVGKKQLKNCKKIMLGLLSDGQAEPPYDYPNNYIPALPGSCPTFLWGGVGTGKTLTAKIFSASFTMPFCRIQCTSDLMPADLVGAAWFNEATRQYERRIGPLGQGHFILLDELSRIPEKTQSAGLEVFESWTITIAGMPPWRIDPKKEVYFGCATGNPAETGGVFGLSDALLDRIGMFLIYEYLSDDEEMDKMLTISETYTNARTPVTPVMSEEGLVEMRDFRRNNTVFSKEAKSYIRRVIKAFRNRETEEYYFGDLGFRKNEYQQLIKTATSDRAMGMFFGHLAKTAAFRQGEYLVGPEHAKEVAADCLSHRVKITQKGLGFRRKYFPYDDEIEFKRRLVEAVLNKEEVYEKKDKRP